MRTTVLPVGHTLELDIENQCLRRGSETIPLTRKAFAVLHHLVTHPDQLITKRAILAAAWPNAHVEEAQVKQFVSHLRQLLHDDADTPRFIQTVHGRGYRYLGGIALAEASTALVHKSPVVRLATANGTQPPAADEGLIGRAGELQTLEALFKEACAGIRRTAMICGEPGIGKTALVTHFLDKAATHDSLWRLNVRCVHRAHGEEPLLPVVDALEELLGEVEDPELAVRIQRLSPTWAQRMAFGKERAVRAGTGIAAEHAGFGEFSQLLDSLSAERPVVINVDDVHWADEATIGLIAYLATMSRRGRVMILCTCQAQEALTDLDPCRQLFVRLRAHGLGTKLVLAALDRDAVERYVAAHLPQHDAELAGLLFEETEGHPLYLSRVVETFAREGVPANACATNRIEVPYDVRELIEHDLYRLDEQDRDLLEAASLIGRAFSAALIASACALEPEAAEQRCEALARQKRFIRRDGVAQWPDGTVAARYAFIHRIAARVFETRLLPQRATRLHRQIASRLEAAYAGETDAILGDLGRHLAAGGDPDRGADTLRRAGMTALAQNAFDAAESLLRGAAETLAGLPRTSSRTCCAAKCWTLVASLLHRSLSLNNARIEHAYAQMRALMPDLTEADVLGLAGWRLGNFHLLRGELAIADEAATAALDRMPDTAPAWAHSALHCLRSWCAFHRGNMDEAMRHAEHGLAFESRCIAQALPAAAPYDPAAHCRIAYALARWVAGYGVDAAQQMAHARALAEASPHPYALALTYCFSAKLSVFARDAEDADHYARLTLGAATANGFTLPRLSALVVSGWAQAQRGEAREGVEKIREGMRALAAAGARIGRGWHATMLAEAEARLGDMSAAISALDTGLAEMHASRDCIAESELHRIKGDLMHEARRAIDAHRAWQTSLTLARESGAKRWELRTTVRVTSSGDQSAPGATLTDVIESMPEVCDSYDFREAHRLLAVSGQRAGRG